MAVMFWTNAPGLARDGTYLNPALDWTMCGWYQLPTGFVATPGADLWFLAPDKNFSTPWVEMGAVDDGGLVIEGVADVSTGIAEASVGLDTWVHAALRYNAGTHALSVVFNGTAYADTGTTNLDSMPPQVLEQIGPGGNGDSGGFLVKQVRVWQQLLTPTQLVTESLSEVAVIPALSDTPLANWGDLTDISGNGNDWAKVGVAFNSDFADINLADFDVEGTAGQIIPDPDAPLASHPASRSGLSFDEGRAMTCSYFYDPEIPEFSPQAWAGRQIQAVVPDVVASGVVRFQYAAFLSPSFDPPPDPIYPFPPGTKFIKVLRTYNSNVWDSFSGGECFTQLFLWSDGTLVLQPSNDGALPFNQYGVSAAGAMPTDGTMHGLSLVLCYTDTNTLAYELFVDDVSVLSGTYVTFTSMTCDRAWNVVNGDVSACVISPGVYEHPSTGIAQAQWWTYRYPDCSTGSCQDVAGFAYVEVEVLTGTPDVRSNPAYSVPAWTGNSCITTYTARARYLGSSTFAPSIGTTDVLIS